MAVACVALLGHAGRTQDIGLRAGPLQYSNSGCCFCTAQHVRHVQVLVAGPLRCSCTAASDMATWLRPDAGDMAAPRSTQLCSATREHCAHALLFYELFKHWGLMSCLGIHSGAFTCAAALHEMGLVQP
jgi:hypothetical protein